jgi:hypothetical protein
MNTKDENLSTQVSHYIWGGIASLLLNVIGLIKKKSSISHRRIDVNAFFDASNLAMNDAPGQMFPAMCIIIIVSLFRLHDKRFVLLVQRREEQKSDQFKCSVKAFQYLSSLFVNVSFTCHNRSPIFSTGPMRNTLATEKSTSSSSAKIDW